MIFSSTDRRHVSQSRCWDQLQDAESGELTKARSTMRALLTLATLKPTEDRLTGSVVLALMNWMSKGDRATAPFSERSFPSQGVFWDIMVRTPQDRFGCG
jgi:hypothetical protein